MLSAVGVSSAEVTTIVTGSSPDASSTLDESIPERSPETVEEADRILREAGFDPDEVGRRMHAVAMVALARSKFPKLHGITVKGYLIEPPDADEVFVLCNSIRKAMDTNGCAVTALELAYADLALEWLARHHAAASK
jgi:hypothetical protein